MDGNHPSGGSARSYILDLILLLLFVAGSAAGSSRDGASTPPKARSPLPILLPLLERGQLPPERAARLLGGGLDAALAEWALPSRASSQGCDELTSLDRPSVPDSLDVLHYDVVVTDVDESAKSIAATTTVTLTALRDLVALDLDLTGQTVDSLETRLGTANAWIEAPFLHDGLVLHVGLPDPVSSGDTLEVRVEYHSAGSGCINTSGLPSGVVFSTVGVHTFSEPGYANRWYPCHDVPWDRATFSISLAPAPGRVASASGLFADSLAIRGRMYARWITPQPVSTYLNAFYLGNYVTFADTAASGIPLEYFTYPNLADLARVDFANVPDMVDFYSGFYPYPNARYAMSLGYFPGGMEHQMNSLIGYFFIRGDRSSESLFAHELAHQWWGDLVTVDSWRHLWLNEGFATYFDLLYTEHRYGWYEMRARIAFTDSVYQARLDLLDHPILDPPLDKLFSFTVYEKGARVLDMLRAVSRMRFMTGPPAAPESFADEIAAGDARFFSIFPEYAARHAWGNVTTADFQTIAEEALGEDLDWFFTPWLEGTAFPTWETDWNATPYADGTFLEVQLGQKSTDPTRFVMPLPIRYRSGDRVLEEVRVVGSDRTAWTVALPRGEWTVEVDPEHWVLDSVEAKTLIPDSRALAVRPNPSSRGFTLTAAQGAAGPVTFTVHDLQGREVRRLDFGTVAPGPLSFQWDGLAQDGTRVAPGVYFGRLTLGSKNAVTRLVVLR